MSQYNTPNEFMKGGYINSNSKFYYKDLTSNNFDNRIKLNHQGETKMDNRNQIPTHHLYLSVVKEFPLTDNAFSRANCEEEITHQISHHKYQQLLKKDKDINKITNKRNKSIKDNFLKKREDLKNELVGIVKDTLIFSKKNNPMMSMIPQNLLKYKEEKKVNLSSASLNISAISKGSSRSIPKYESNVFLKELGLDLLNLSPDNIKLDIDKAYDFIDNWKTDRKKTEVIRYKLVNEITSVEEKKASQKADKIKSKLINYKKKKKEQKLKIRRKIEEALKKKENEEDPKVKLRKKMLSSIKSARNFNSNKKTNKGEIKRNNSTVVKTKNKKGNIKEVKTDPKTMVKMDSYTHIDKILQFVHDSDNLSENTSICNHFLNIKSSQKMNDIKNKLLLKNKIQTTFPA